MKYSALSSSKNIFFGITLLASLAGNSAWAVCAPTFGTFFNAGCTNTINNTETGLATTNTNLATTNTNLATTNTNLATTNTNLATTNTNLATTNTNLTAGDAATLASSKSYTDAKALSISADTLSSANSYTNAKTAETLKSANAYTDTRAAETLKSANNYTTEQVQKLDTKTAAGIAATAAMVNIPAPSTAGKSFSIGVAIGNYDGQTALAIGGQKRFAENGLARFGIAGSTSKGSKPVIGAGAAWEF